MRGLTLTSLDLNFEGVLPSGREIFNFRGVLIGVNLRLESILALCHTRDFAPNVISCSSLTRVVVIASEWMKKI
jgi:hypothetical protein